MANGFGSGATAAFAGWVLDWNLKNYISEGVFSSFVKVLDPVRRPCLLKEKPCPQMNIAQIFKVFCRKLYCNFLSTCFYSISLGIFLMFRWNSDTKRVAHLNLLQITCDIECASSVTSNN